MGPLMTELEPVDSRLDWRGVVEFEPVGSGWWQPWRLPWAQAMQASAGDLVDRAKDAAGARLVIAPGITALELTVRGRPEAPIDVLVDGRLHDRVRIDGEHTIVAPIKGASQVEIWLPQFGHVQVGSVRVEGTPVRANGLARWTAYGSSITQCRTAIGPSETWPALVARRNNWDVSALGFGGECHLDPVAATTVRDIPADLISLCLGVNVYYRGTFSDRTFVPAILGFIERVRERRDCPLLVIGPIFSPAGESHANRVDLTLERVRELVRDAADRSGTQYLDGRTLLSEREANLLEDGLHPGQAGYDLIAERINPVLLDMLR